MTSLPPPPPEPWLRGPVPGIEPLLMPVAHSLLQIREDLERHAAPLTSTELWTRPGGAASVGFHLRHIAGSLDRLFSYARGEQLTPGQLSTLRSEGEPGDPPSPVGVLLANAQAAIAIALTQLAQTPSAALTDVRRVGRAGLPSTVLGLLFHGAEHAQRHTGQLIATAKVVRAGRAGAEAEGSR